MSTVGYATLQVIPSMSGVGAKIRGALTGEMGQEGQRAGKAGADGVESKFGGRMAAFGAAAAVALGAAFVATLSKAMDVEQANDRLAAQLGATGKWAGDLGEMAGNLYADAYGESLEQVNDALRGVLQSGAVMEDASTGQIESITAKVLDLSTAFGQDLGGTTNAVAQMIRTGLAKDADEALDILTRGFQQGNDKAGDLLDTVNEYGTQFRKLGLDGTASMGLINQAIRAGARDSDIAADALKEFSIRAVDGSELTAQGFAMVGLNAGKMSEAIAAGGPTASAALDQVLDGLRGIEDPATRAQAAVALFGTQAEDLGAALYAMDPSEAVGALGEVGGAAEKMGQSLNDNAATKVEEFKRRLQGAAVDFIGNTVLPKLNELSDWIKTNLGPVFDTVFGGMSEDTEEAGEALSGFQETVQDVKDAVGPIMEDLRGIFQSALDAITGAWGMFGGTITEYATSTIDNVMTIIQGGLEVIQGIFDVFAGLFTGDWSRVWDGIKGIVSGAWEVIKGMFSQAMNIIGTVLSLAWDLIKGIFGGAWDWIVEKVSSAWNAVTGAISAGIGTAVSFVTGLPGRILGALGDFGGLLFDKGKDLMQGLVDGIASAAGFVGDVARNIVNAVIGFLNSAVIDGINGLLEFKIPVPGAPDIRVNPPDIPRIPRLAEGGIVPATPGGVLAFIGEAGEDEMVLPRSKARSILGAAAGGDQGGRPINLTVNARQEIDIPALARQVARELAWGTS